MGSDKNDSSTAPPSSSHFSEGEKVLAYHGPLIYEAKVQKAELVETEWRYYVHYLGWNKNWDEWVATDRLLKHTEENVLKQQYLDKKPVVDKNPRGGRATQIKPKSSFGSKNVAVGRGKKRKNDTNVELHIHKAGHIGSEEGSKHGARDSEKGALNAKKLIKIQIPSTLKKQLVDDWSFVTQKDKLVKLPRSPNVDDILKKYLEYRSKKDCVIIDYVSEILNGIRCYFDKALPALLLYKDERQQYHRTVLNNSPPSTIYGAEHLLRLFVKLPELLACVSMEEETLISLQQKLLDFLRFLQKNQGTFFSPVYEEGNRSIDGKFV